MGSLVVKIDGETNEKLGRRYQYSDIDVLSYKAPVWVQSEGGKKVQTMEVPMSYDVDAVKASVRNILMWRVGESVLRPEFGHRLNRSMYQQMNKFNKDAVCEEVKRAIEENEPRAVVDGVDAREMDDPDSNALNVVVTYHVVGHDEDGVNLVEQTQISGE